VHTTDIYDSSPFIPQTNFLKRKVGSYPGVWGMFLSSTENSSPQSESRQRAILPFSASCLDVPPRLREGPKVGWFFCFFSDATVCSWSDGIRKFFIYLPRARYLEELRYSFFPLSGLIYPKLSDHAYYSTVPTLQALTSEWSGW